MIDNSDPYDKPAGTKVWTYTRSTPHHQHLFSMEDKIKSLIAEKGWVLDRMFHDTCERGKANSRVAFEQMIYLSNRSPRPADLIIISDFRDLGRDQFNASLYQAELRHNGWEILSVNEDISNGSLSSLYERFIDWKNERFLIELRANIR